MKRFTSALEIFCLLALLPITAGGQITRPLPIEDALRTREFCELTPILLSPDGRWLAYTVAENQKTKTVDDEKWPRSGVPAWVNETDIWILNVATGEATNLTGAKGDNWLPTWSPDGQHLAFLSDRDASGQARLWTWDVRRNDLKKISDIDIRAIQIEWTLDSQKILLTTLPEGLSAKDYIRKLSSAAAPDQNSVGMKVPGSTVSLYQASAVSAGQHEAPKSDPWSLNWAMWDLASVDINTGKATIIVHGQRVAWHLLSPDGSRIAFANAKRFEKPGSQQVLYDLATITLSTMVERVVAPDIRLNTAGNTFGWSPNSQQLSYRTFGMEDKAHDCYVVDANGSQVNITKLVPPQRSNYFSGIPLWSSDGKSVYFINEGGLWRASVAEHKAVELARIRNREITALIPLSDDSLWTPDGGQSTLVVAHDDVGKQDGFYRIDLMTGESTKLLEKGQCFTCTNLRKLFSVDKDAKSIVFFAEDAQHDTEAWLTSADFKNPRRLTHLNPQFDNYEMGSARVINWLSDDGDVLHGALLLPIGYQDGKRYPLIVYVYGGSLLSNKLDLFGLAGRGPFNMQLLATRGYAVLLPDAPQRLGTPMLDLAKTVLPGVNKVVEMGIADPDRLGVMGHSYGGYSTLSLVVQTKRFRAAVEVDGLGDLMSSYGQMGKDGTAFQTSITERGQGLMGGSPWEFRQRYIENSPIFYLDRIETPLLIIHGAEDRTVSAFLADEMFVGLRRLGKEVEYAKYKGESHDPSEWSYANQVDFCNRLIEWFDKNMKTAVGQ